MNTKQRIENKKKQLERQYIELQVKIEMASKLEFGIQARKLTDEKSIILEWKDFLDYLLSLNEKEISDEEIQKAAEEYSEVYQCPSEIKMCKHDVISSWNNAIKWYREQLKTKKD